MHGYLIIQELQNRSPAADEKLDNTGVYRTLKVMEQKGLVAFEWDIDGSGAAKKVYQITNGGRECLSNWLGTLEEYKLQLAAVIHDVKISLDDAY